MIAHGVRKLRELSELQKPEKQETGVAAFDDFTGGLLRGGVCEISGSESSGKRGLVLSVLGGLTRRNFICAVVDTSDAFDPDSAQKAGVNLNKILMDPLRRRYSKSAFDNRSSAAIKTFRVCLA